MSDRKTRPTDDSVARFLAGVEHDVRRRDAEAAVALIGEVTGSEPVLWGGSIVGFGVMPYTTADGKHHEWFAVGVAPRKASLTFYGLTSYGSNQDLLDGLGPHTTGKGCVYVKRLGDLEEPVLRDLVARAWRTNHAPDGQSSRS
jgi:hypothetical protein